VAVTVSTSGALGTVVIRLLFLSWTSIESQVTVSVLMVPTRSHRTVVRVCPSSSEEGEGGRCIIKSVNCPFFFFFSRSIMFLVVRGNVRILALLFIQQGS